MSWRDELRTGMFRSAEFFFRQADATVGRKTARHDYPLRDDAYIEDMGKRPREFTLDCYVIGPDYMDKRDALIAALEEDGPGLLVHPTMGMLWVNVLGDVRVTESTTEGGMCRFSIPFILVGEKKYPAAATDTASQVETAADNLVELEEEDFAEVFTCDGVAQYVADDAMSLTDEICDTLDNLRKQIPTSVQTPQFMKDLNRIRTSVSMLVAAPFLLARSVAGQFYAFKNLALAPIDLVNFVTAELASLMKVRRIPMDIYNAYARLFGYGKNYRTIPTTTPSRIRQLQNRNAITALVRRIAIAEAARTSAGIAYSSFDEAIGVQGRLAEAIDEEVLTAPDTVYAALVDLRAAVVLDVSVRGANLARIVKYTPVRTEPAFLIAHRLYGDVTRAEEIIERNRIVHPLFVPGGLPLEVLSD